MADAKGEWNDDGLEKAELSWGLQWRKSANSSDKRERERESWEFPALR